MESLKDTAGAKRFRPYIDPIITKEVKDLYNGDGTEGVNNMLNAYLAQRKIVLRELKEIGFSQQEMIGIVAAFNGTFIDYTMISPKDMLVAEMRDSIELEGMYHDYDREPFLAKLNTLTNIQAATLMEEVKRFWQNEKRDLEAFSVKFDKTKATQNMLLISIEKLFKSWNEVRINNGLEPIGRDEFDETLAKINKNNTKYVCVKECYHWSGRVWKVGDIISEVSYILHEHKECFEELETPV